MSEPVDEGPFQNFVAVGWPSAEFYFRGSGYANNDTRYVLSIELGSDGFASMLAKWNAGARLVKGATTGSEFDYTNIPFVTAYTDAIELPTVGAASPYQYPFYDQDGNIVEYSSVRRPILAARPVTVRSFGAPTGDILQLDLFALPSRTSYRYRLGTEKIFGIDTGTATIKMGTHYPTSYTETYNINWDGLTEDLDDFTDNCVDAINAGTLATASKISPTPTSRAIRFQPRSYTRGFYISSFTSVSDNSPPVAVFRFSALGPVLDGVITTTPDIGFDPRTTIFPPHDGELVSLVQVPPEE